MRSVSGAIPYAVPMNALNSVLVGIDYSEPSDNALREAARIAAWEGADLIAGGARTDIANQDGRTALMEAVIAQRADLVRSLLDAGAAPDVRDRQGKTAMEMARLRDDETIRGLLAGSRNAAKSDSDVAGKLAMVNQVRIEEMLCSCVGA